MRSMLTVIQPADSHDLTTLETAKRELGITDDDQDAHILDQIHAASNAIATYCDRVFGLETVEERFWPDADWGYSMHATSLLLNRTPIVEVTSVSIDGTPLAVSDYRIDKRVGILYRLGANWPCWYNWWGTTDGIVITYRGGYQLLDGIPFAIERACLNMVKEYSAAVGRDPALRSIEVPGLGKQEFTVGGTQVDQHQLSPMVTGLLEPFKRHV